MKPPHEWATILIATKWALVVTGFGWMSWTIVRDDLNPLGRIKRHLMALSLALIGMSLTALNATTIWGHSVGYFTRYCPDSPALAYPYFVIACSAGITFLSLAGMGFASFRYGTRPGRCMANFFHEWL